VANEESIMTESEGGLNKLAIVQLFRRQMLWRNHLRMGLFNLNAAMTYHREEDIQNDTLIYRQAATVVQNVKDFAGDSQSLQPLTH